MNTFGKNFRVSIFGESHGEALGIVIDGVPSGMPLSESDFTTDINRRRSGALGTTPRAENDTPKIISGIYKGHTTGAPLTVIFTNGDADSSSYCQYLNTPRPGHADFTAAQRFGMWNDTRGSGHFSGRMTLPVVAAGVVAKKVLNAVFATAECPPEPQSKTKAGANYISARLLEIGGESNPSKWRELLIRTVEQGDSIGGVVECCASVPSGMGNPFWDSVESLISHAVFSIPGVRGIEFGDGFKAARMKGSEHNDPFGEDGKPSKNGAGGINGGITNGAPICFRVAFKPTSTIALPQETFNFETGKMQTLRCGGRHDVCFALRTPVIVEAMTALALADLLY